MFFPCHYFQLCPWWAGSKRYILLPGTETGIMSFSARAFGRNRMCMHNIFIHALVHVWHVTVWVKSCAPHGKWPSEISVPLIMMEAGSGECACPFLALSFKKIQLVWLLASADCWDPFIKWMSHNKKVTTSIITCYSLSNKSY